jgi:hypothetical protein
MDLCVDVTQIRRRRARGPFAARLRQSAATIVAASGGVIVAFDRHFIFARICPNGSGAICL